jgi:hypothetical protein
VVSFSNDVKLTYEPSGELELFVDGQSIILAKGLILRKTVGSSVRGLHWQTFFGGKFTLKPMGHNTTSFHTDLGHTEEWASPTDQYAWFADISGAIVA